MMSLPTSLRLSGRDPRGRAAPRRSRSRGGAKRSRGKLLMIAIVDYKAGNLTSVARALDHLGHRCEITDRPEKVRAADRVILPGVGAAGATMENLRALGLHECLRNDVAKAGTPFLGICIGIQVLLDHSDEDGGVA